MQALLPKRSKEKKIQDSKSEFPIYNTGYSDGTKKLDRARSDWVLTTTEKKWILLNNIFGVDIDHPDANREDTDKLQEGTSQIRRPDQVP